MCIYASAKKFRHILFFAVLILRGYMPAPRFTVRVLLTIEFGLNILGNPVTLLTYLFVLKMDCRMFKVTVAITSFKNIVACCRSISNPV